MYIDQAIESLLIRQRDTYRVWRHERHDRGGGAMAQTKANHLRDRLERAIEVIGEELHNVLVGKMAQLSARPRGGVIEDRSGV